MGDVKLFALYGWSIGFPHVLIALFIASLFGSMVGYSMRVLKLLKPGQHMPFAPYLALGSIIMYGYGDRLIDWYLTLIR
ncbi:Type 4 prepilin-like proteins leader peptide-processing enzyme [compost metagenome]